MGMPVNETLTYYATFIPGLQDCIADVVKERLPDVVIQKLLDGAIVFETACTYDRLNFFCFNNIFLVSGIVEHASGKPAPAGNSGIAGPQNAVPQNAVLLETHMKKAIAAGKNDPVIAHNNKKIQSFRIICSIENKLVPVNEKIKQETERFIAAASGMAVNRSLPDTEFWFLYRSEGFSVFMKRLTKHGSFDKTLHPGELPPPLAWMLCRLSNPKNTDTVIDPFCGYGAIPAERIKRFPLKKFYALDKDNAVLAHTRQKITHSGGKSMAEFCHIERADINAALSICGEAAADAIITDPPWGMYEETGIPLQEFYDGMMKIFAGLLKPAGTLVLLTAKKDELLRAAEKVTTLTLNRTIPILLSGRKAGIFVFVRQLQNRLF
jgi:16S rRNA G966 N2-methylase RsmD